MFIVLVLAALAATSAAAFPDVPATAHRPAQAKISHRKTAHHAAPKASSAKSSRPQASARGYRAGRSTSAKKRAAAPAPHLSRAGVTRVHVRTSVRPASLRRTRYVVTASPLRGSLESLTRQNERMEADGLERILDEDDLADRIDQKLLVPLPASGGLTINPSLIETHRYCRPWTADFLTELATAHAEKFSRPLFVSSAVRTVEYQQHLMHRNGNAAAAEGDIVSPHLTGGTIDIAKSGMSRAELAWMRNWLLAQQLSGAIDVEEEFRQPCFHITVYKNHRAPSTPTLEKAAGDPAAPAPAAQVTPDGVSEKPDEQ